MIVLEGQKILSWDQKLTQNPPNFLHEVKFLPDVNAFTGAVKQWKLKFSQFLQFLSESFFTSYLYDKN